MDVPNRLNGEFEAVLRYLKESRGFDFTGYKRTSLARRVRPRMAQVGIDQTTCRSTPGSSARSPTPS